MLKTKLEVAKAALNHFRHHLELMAHMVTNFLFGKTAELMIETHAHFLVIGHIHQPMVAPLGKNATDDETDIAAFFESR